MSAVPVIAPDSGRTQSTDRPHRLRLVRPARPRMGPVTYLTFLLGLVGIGMVGLLLLNTHLQNQAFQATELRRQAAEMSYAEGELTQLVVEAGSTQELTRKATELGLRPNRGIAFIEIPSGTITGKPTPDDGLFLPSALTLSPEDIAQQKAKDALTRAGERRQAEAQVAEEQRQRILDARAAAQAQSGQIPAGQVPAGQAQAQGNGAQPNQTQANQTQTTQTQNNPTQNNPTQATQTQPQAEGTR